MTLLDEYSLKYKLFTQSCFSPFLPLFSRTFLSDGESSRVFLISGEAGGNRGGGRQLAQALSLSADLGWGGHGNLTSELASPKDGLV